MIKFILTDLDGVIRKWNNQKLNELEKDFNVTDSKLFSICFDKVILQKVITGEITDEAWRKMVGEKYSDKHSHIDTKQIIETWNNSEYEIDYGVLELYKKHYPEAKIALLTNATSRLNKDLTEANIIGSFDFIFNSSEIGFAKPDIRYFEKVKEKMTFHLSEAVYIDDTTVNIEAAKKFGLRSLLYDNIDKLNEFLLIK